MKLFFSCESRFVKKHGQIYSINGGFTTALFSRYLEVYDEVVVIARVLSDDNYLVNSNWLVSNDRVSFVELPYYIGPLQYLMKRERSKKIISDSISKDSSYICRLPGQIGSMVIQNLLSKGIKYGIEVVGDPWGVFAPAAVRHPLRVYFRYSGLYKLKRLVKKASAALYVTEKSLQGRYPVAKNCFSTFASNVQINKENLPSKAHVWTNKAKFNLISVGSLAQMYKAPDIVIKALKVLMDRNFFLHLTWLGDGKYRKDMEDLASSLGVSDMISFLGNVTAEEVREKLLSSDIFLLVSRTEGLPRAVVEAMAMGLPCIGSNVGGIPELLNESSIVPKGDVIALADKIEEFINKEEFYNNESIRNFEEAKKFYSDVLRDKRIEFYKKVKQLNYGKIKNGCKK